jgi:hypothetical protein
VTLLHVDNEVTSDPSMTCVSAVMKTLEICYENLKGMDFMEHPRIGRRIILKLI